MDHVAVELRVSTHRLGGVLRNGERIGLDYSQEQCKGWHDPDRSRARYVPQMAGTEDTEDSGHVFLLSREMGKRVVRYFATHQHSGLLTAAFDQASPEEEWSQDSAQDPQISARRQIVEAHAHRQRE